MLTGRLSEFSHLINKFETVELATEEEREDHQKVLGKLSAAARGEIWLSVKELEEDVLARDNSFDLALIRACRNLVSAYLIQNQEVCIHGISIKDAILPSYPDCADIDGYCTAHVKKMGIDAEGAFVYLGTNGLTIFFFIPLL